MQVLSTIDVSALSRGTRFCNELGYDVEPIFMISMKRDAKDEIEPLYWAKDKISIRDLSSALVRRDINWMQVQLKKCPVVIMTL